jgi:glucokinase-like ROK family protein
MTKKHVAVDSLSSSRDLHRLEVFETIRREKLVNRSGLSRLVSSSRPTVSMIVSEMVRLGLLAEVGEGISTGGRKPLQLKYCPESRKAIGVVFFNDQVQAALTDLDGNLLQVAEGAIHGSSPDAMLEAMATVVDRIRAGIPRAEILGVGAGVPGLVEFETGVIEISVSQGWLKSGVNVKQYLEQQLDLPVYVANRSRVAALGELVSGIGKDINNLVYLYLGQGIAAGIVIDGQLFLGSSSGSGEIGHVSVDPDGPLCDCGNHGCLEIFASEAGIMARARATAREHSESALQNMVEGHLEMLGMDHLVAAGLKGDPAALSVFEAIGRKIGMAVSILINLFDPEMVVIGGPIGSGVGELLLEPAKHEVKLRSLSRSFHRTRIVTGTLGIKAATVGAAALVIRHTPIDTIFRPENWKRKRQLISV